MRKILTLLLVSITILSQAQKGKVMSATTYLSGAQIKEAKEAIDAAFSSPEVEAMAKAWKVKGDVYKEIYTNNLEAILNAPNSLSIAHEAYLKAYDLDMAAEKKPGKYKKDIAKGMFTVARGMFEQSITLFNEDKLAEAIEGFEGSKAVVEFLEGKGMLAEADKENAETIKRDALKNSALCAIKSEDYDQAATYYEALIQRGEEDVDIFANLSSIYISKGKFEEAKSVIDKGIAKHPDNESLKESELNYYIGTGQSDMAIERLEKAIAANPNEPDLYFNLALAYDKLDKKDKMIEAYDKAIEIDPEYQAAYLNLGAYYNEQANEVIKQINDLTDWKEAVKLEPQRDEWYGKAMPYLEKAYELDNSNPAVKRVLERIYANLNMLDKVNELKSK